MDTVVLDLIVAYIFDSLYEDEFINSLKISLKENIRENVRKIEIYLNTIDRCLRDLTMNLSTLIEFVRGIDPSSSNITLKRLLKIKEFMNNIEDTFNSLKTYLGKIVIPFKHKFYTFMSYYRVLFANDKASGGFLYKTIKNFKDCIEEFYRLITESYFNPLKEYIDVANEISEIKDEITKSLKEDLKIIFRDSSLELRKIEYLKELEELKEVILEVRADMERTNSVLIEDIRRLESCISKFAQESR